MKWKSFFCFLKVYLIRKNGLHNIETKVDKSILAVYLLSAFFIAFAM